MGFFIVVIILVVTIGGIIAIHNALVALKQRVKNAEAQIDIQLKRRFDLVPNLVETVKGYAKHEAKTLENVIAARNACVSATSMGEKATANNNLANGLKSIFALVESYPDLKANQNFLELQNEIIEIEENISYARQFYNDIVQMYNTKIMIFPNGIIASMFNFKEEEFFEIMNPEERENVKISFDD